MVQVAILFADRQQHQHKHEHIGNSVAERLSGQPIRWCCEQWLHGKDPLPWCFKDSMAGPMELEGLRLGDDSKNLQQDVDTLQWMLPLEMLITQLSMCGLQWLEWSHVQSFLKAFAKENRVTGCIHQETETTQFQIFNDRNRKQRFKEATITTISIGCYSAGSSLKNHPKKHLVIIRIQVSIEITFPPQWRIWDAIRVDEYPT